MHISSGTHVFHPSIPTDANPRLLLSAPTPIAACGIDASLRFEPPSDPGKNNSRAGVQERGGG